MEQKGHRSHRTDEIQNKKSLEVEGLFIFVIVSQIYLDLSLFLISLGETPVCFLYAVLKYN